MERIMSTQTLPESHPAVWNKGKLVGQPVGRMSEALSAACDELALHSAEGTFGFSALRYVLFPFFPSRSQHDTQTAGDYKLSPN